MKSISSHVRRSSAEMEQTSSTDPFLSTERSDEQHLSQGAMEQAKSTASMSSTEGAAISNTTTRTDPGQGVKERAKSDARAPLSEDPLASTTARHRTAESLEQSSNQTAKEQNKSSKNKKKGRTSSPTSPYDSGSSTNEAHQSSIQSKDASSQASNTESLPFQASSTVESVSGRMSSTMPTSLPHLASDTGTRSSQLAYTAEGTSRNTASQVPASAQSGSQRDTSSTTSTSELDPISSDFHPQSEVHVDHHSNDSAGDDSVGAFTQFGSPVRVPANRNQRLPPIPENGSPHIAQGVSNTPESGTTAQSNITPGLVGAEATPASDITADLPNTSTLFRKDPNRRPQEEAPIPRDRRYTTTYSMPRPDHWWWQLDSIGFPCAKRDCERRCNLWDDVSVVCPQCGPHSEIRYCCTEHLYDDVKWHWPFCGHFTFAHPCQESTIPHDVREAVPFIPSMHHWDTPERHRQALYFATNMREGDYFIFTDWADLRGCETVEDDTVRRCSNQVVEVVRFDDPAEKDRFRRALAICLFGKFLFFSFHT